jgi:isoquinoline 1-oxidoreductase subunit beta
MDNNVRNESRRKFIQGSAAAGGAFVLGLHIPNKAHAVSVSHATTRLVDFPKDAFAPNAWVRVTKDNKVSIFASRSEMGQGVYTSMPMLVAEEMEIDLKDVQVGIPPAAPPYINRIFGAQLTGGSTSIRDSFTYLRQAGAAARIMFINAAAKQWSMDASKLWAEKGYVMGPGDKKASYGSLVDAASQEQEPKDPPLKDPSKWTIIGQPLRRFDSQYKVNGQAEFGIDVKVPGMMLAAVEMPPVIGGNVTGMDEAAAMKSPGVKKIFKFNDTYTNGVCCIADSFWNAKQGLKAANVQFDGGKNAGLSSEKISSMLADGMKAESVEAKSRGDVAAALGKGKTISGEYELQFLSHSPMECMNATAIVKDDGAEVWAPTQFQTLVPPSVAQATGLKPEQVNVHTTFLGGGFGRKIEMDFIIQAALAAKEMKGTPVKLIWSRENDMTNDSYRPVSLQRIDAAIDGNGYPTAWKYKIASPSITSRMFPGAIQKGVDPFMLEAAENFPYDVPNWNLSLTMVDTGQRVGYWRAVSNNLNAFAQEVFIDELAHDAKKDPVEYRRVLLRDKPRYLGVIDLAVAKSGYGKGSLGAGRSHGVAVIECYETYGCLIAETEVTADGKIKLHKMTYAVDAGRLINPNISHQQIVSGVVSGLQNAFSEITVVGGAVQETNFHKYYIPRMADVPVIDVHFVASDEKPGGLGEVGVPLVAPAISNAVFNATGKRLRKTPFKPGITA